MTAAQFYQKHRRLTRSLKNFISEQQSAFTEDVFLRFLEALSEELDRLRDLLMQVPSGPARAQRIHQMVDAEMEQEKSIPISCTKGCNHCCHMEVEITSDEALILKGILADGFAIDRDRFIRQSQRPLQDETWRRRHFHPENRCIFLAADGACSVYEARPVMCRRHTVTSPAVHCQSLEQAISIRYFPRVDLIISAANEDPALRVGPLAKMLALTTATD